MKPHDQPHGLCSIDPVTAGIGLITAIASYGMQQSAMDSAQSMAAQSQTAPGTTAPTPPPSPAAAAPQVQSPAAPSGSGGAKAGGGSNTSSFVGSAAVPSQVGYGSKTLLGQ